MVYKHLSHLHGENDLMIGENDLIIGENDLLSYSVLPIRRLLWAVSGCQSPPPPPAEY